MAREVEVESVTVGRGGTTTIYRRPPPKPLPPPPAPVRPMVPRDDLEWARMSMWIWVGIAVFGWFAFLGQVVYLKLTGAC